MGKTLLSPWQIEMNVSHETLPSPRCLVLEQIIRVQSNGYSPSMNLKYMMLGCSQVRTFSDATTALGCQASHTSGFIQAVNIPQRSSLQHIEPFSKLIERWILRWYGKVQRKDVGVMWQPDMGIMVGRASVQ